MLSLRKALEQKTVCVYANTSPGWKLLGEAKTDEEGSFSFPVSGDQRLPSGLTKLHLSVVGDSKEADFVALIADKGTKLVISDVDGTLTQFETPIPPATISNEGANQDAPQALQTLRDRGYWVLYMTARTDGDTNKTRQWLHNKGFPDGPLHLVPEIISLSNAASYKANAMREIIDSGVVISAGISNRASDQQAYSAVGIPANRIFILRNEERLRSEVNALRDRACVFESYGSLMHDQFAFQAVACRFSSSPGWP